MTKTLQQIKDEVAKDYMYADWNFAYVNDWVSNSMIDELAIRYAQEQKRELVEMLESVVQLQKDHYGNGSRTHIALILKAKEIDKLITKHKQ